MEDKEPADRLREIWPNIKAIFQYWLRLSKSRQPKGKSFDKVKLAVEDPLTTAKLSFFSYLASLLEPFLKQYQTAKPMIPYMHTDLTKMYKAVMKIIIKDDIVDACSSSELPKLDMEKSGNLKKPSNFTVGFITSRMIKDLIKKDAIQDTNIGNFYSNIKVCVTALIKKLNERSPLLSVVVWSSSIFNPVTMSQVKSTILHKRLMKLLQHIESLGLVKASNCDKITSQFSSLKSDVESHPGDLQVMFPEKRLDEFYFKTMKVGTRYPELSVVLKIILTLSHGQADVERVFSLNKGTLQTSIGENSIVSKRLVKDHMLTNGLKPHEMDFL